MAIVKGNEGMEEAARAFVDGLQPRADGATVVAIEGELGAGKTAFVKGIAKSLGVEEHVTSPTFVILKAYDLHDQKFKKLVHMDAYRLKGEQHLRALDWDAYMRDPGNLICIEWPQMAGAGVPASAIRFTLRYSGDHEREIVYEEEAGVA